MQDDFAIVRSGFVGLGGESSQALDRIEAAMDVLRAQERDVHAAWAAELRAKEERDKARADAERLAEAMPDPVKLHLLADWMDMRYPGDPDPEVQRDLRAWGDAIHAAFAAHEKAR